MKRVAFFRGKISKELKLFMLVACMILAPICDFYGSSLSDVANGSNESNAESTADLFSPTGNNALEAMQGSENVSGEVAGISEFRSLAQRITAFIVQAIMIVLTLGMVVISSIDLLYIVLPPLRDNLSGGQQGVPVAQAGQMGQQNGFGNSGFGGGFGGGFGNNSMGGGFSNSGFGNNGMGQQNQQSSKCYVSEAALNAVATAKADNSGKLLVALKIWSKNVVVQLVAIPVIVTLLMTGVMQKIGWGIGGLIDRALQNVHF